jgi:hypothetical protein
MLAPFAASTAWPSVEETDELTRIVHEQAETISEQFGLLHDYQDVLDAAQAVSPVPPLPPAQASATASGNVWTFSNVSGLIQIGAAIVPTLSNANIPAGLTVATQTSGPTGGAGVYTSDQPVTNPVTTAVQVTLIQPMPLQPEMDWPPVTAPSDLMLVVQAQALLIRTQVSAIQQYQDLLNGSQTPVPPA